MSTSTVADFSTLFTITLKAKSDNPYFLSMQIFALDSIFLYQIDPWVFVGKRSERMKVLDWGLNLHLAVVCFFSSCYKEYFYDPSEYEKIYFWKTSQFQTTGLISNMGSCKTCKTGLERMGLVQHRCFLEFYQWMAVLLQTCRAILKPTHTWKPCFLWRRKKG